MTVMLFKLPFFFVADPCHRYSNLTEANRNTKSETTQSGRRLCDSQVHLPQGWYRFVGAAGTRMSTTRVPAFSCGTDWPGWLMTAHPTVENGEVRGKVCFSDRVNGCRYYREIFVKDCGSYFIYKLLPTQCESRYCGTEWMLGKKFKE